ncbi:MAG TPA: FAD-binding oxidoreductase, partial [Thermoguttaceae bacterium]|nr:FAD-binding oxidoreductase [Thermoguttaceae bacterium]
MNPPNQTLPLTETVTPANRDAVAEVVRDACQTGTPVYAIGGGTSLHYGARPTRPGLGLSLAGLNRVIDYPARDLTITVEAGVTIAELAGRLASERQRLPVDIAQAARATVGGVVATNPCGPRRYQWGTVRDYVLGVHAVDGSGTPFSAGGRVVKNAAGYNLCRLLTGSLGTLGVITQVTLMVKPMPETSALVACDLDDFDSAEKLLAEMVHTETVPAAIELLAGPAWQDEPALCAAASDSAAGRLVVGLEGTTAEVEWMIERLEAQWRRSSGVSPTAIRGDAAARAWNRLTEFPAEAPAEEGDAPLVLQISLLPSVTVDFVRRLLGIDAGCSVQAHAGDGVIRARLSCEPGEIAAVLSERLR